MASEFTPLAESVRPQHLDEIFGQSHLIGAGKPLAVAIENGVAHSMVLWGPPGSGKTTLARIITQSLNARMLAISAVMSGVKDIRNAVEQSRFNREQGRATVLFVDEVHRFNKSQQDAFLPHIESGLMIFIGATTENPSFELNSALLSRLKVYVLRKLTQDDIMNVINRAIDLSEQLTATGIKFTEEAKHIFSEMASGDARQALNFMEIAAGMCMAETEAVVDAELAAEIVGTPVARFDKRRDVFYEQISALHKSIRGSDPDAALYWLVRMLDGGCDPLYISRRLVRVASEDIGNADPRALDIALCGWDAYHRLGTPEGELAIAHAVIYMACCPKSNAVYRAFNEAYADAKKKGDLDVPMHLRNAPTRLMKDLGYGKDYRYAHDEEDAYAAGEHYFPSGITPVRYYKPTQRGIEKRIADYMDKLRNMERKS